MCRRATKRRYRERHPDKVRAEDSQYTRRYYHENKGDIRRRERERKYGLSAAEQEVMLIAQSGRCAICTRPMIGRGSGDAVDHCHQTGRVRALLCFQCNNGLGCVQDNIETLEAMIAYLKEHHADC